MPHRVDLTPKNDPYIHKPSVAIQRFCRAGYKKCFTGTGQWWHLGSWRCTSRTGPIRLVGPCHRSILKRRRGPPMRISKGDHIHPKTSTGMWAHPPAHRCTPTNPSFVSCATKHSQKIAPKVGSLSRLRQRISKMTGPNFGH